MERAWSTVKTTSGMVILLRASGAWQLGVPGVPRDGRGPRRPTGNTRYDMGVLGASGARIAGATHAWIDECDGRQPEHPTGVGAAAWARGRCRYLRHRPPQVEAPAGIAVVSIGRHPKPPHHRRTTLLLPLRA